MTYIRTIDPVNWEQFIARRNAGAKFILDFEIDAGFSFAAAVAQRKMKKGAGSVTLDHTLEVPEVVLDVDYYLKDEGVHLKTVSIISLLSPTYEITDKYEISALFSLKKIDYGEIEKYIASALDSNPSIPRQTHLSVYFSSFFGGIATSLKDKIIAHIELSGFFAKHTPASLNLYLTADEGDFRILQQGGGHDSAGHHPFHPYLIKKKNVIEHHEWFSAVPQNIRKHYQKGVHYQFLGFYDESFLCYYKLIETAFKTTKFLDKVTTVLFGSDSKKLRETLNSSNQRMMMLFIYQALIKTSQVIPEENKSKIMEAMLDSSKLRNDVAHSSDQAERSKALLAFIIWLSNLMLNSVR
ncbi:hypothetical protein SB725_08550 [Pseudomonas sp. SIMBA_041]|uniref:hypothetical protein n=1 Tax=Pseudomonas sp. SIMBA_041 TaxID=3085782 RepID=UPI00397D3123